MTLVVSSPLDLKEPAMFAVVRKGERAAVWSRNGDLAVVDGPRRLLTWGRKVEPLKRHIAGIDQYLVVEYLDGRREHLAGPATVWFDPVAHRNVAVKNAVMIAPDQAMLVLDSHQDATTRRRVEGPAVVVPTPEEELIPLARHSAGENECLAVEYEDGRRENLPGPVSLWFDPGVHRGIEKQAALPVDANEAIVVYASEGDAVSRRVERGPGMFVPKAGEWLHAFSWHGTVPDGGGKHPNVLRFKKLRVIPDQLYHDVPEVRTTDDALVTVRLMVFFELVDIEQMLDRTHDPIADFINDLAADVVVFAGQRSFETFKREAEALNELEQYPNLVRRAEGIGYRIAKVVFRGYSASPKLQAMHDGAIEARTGLRLEAETERQAQDLADLKQTRELERADRQRGDETRKNEHTLALQRRAHEESLRRDRERAEQQAALGRADAEAAQVRRRAEYGDQEGFYGALAGLGVDVTRYLVAQYQHPDRLIRVDGASVAAVHVDPA